MRGNLKILSKGAFIILSIALVKHFFFYDVYEREMSKAEKARLEIVDGYKTPPMPDKDQNDKDALGIDSNNNGVRDDIEIWINYAGKNYNERMALRQLAADLQYEAKVFSGDINAKIVSHVVSVVYTSVLCVDHVLGFKNSKEMIRLMRELYKNTKLRTKIFERDNEFSYAFSPVRERKEPQDMCGFKLK
ncbi:hypothetical protein DOM21_16140 [Bacteriovorax stolpii]|uniref:hypothetical protein n=1 Tax=Bacteriovorax stolpii TaxID=960 RepID=UPI001157A880|nr:hypothetical protein [Bacteriovorax stolpii]QDK42953.1 hypothetical protein DOM21_16140 [Bacteriovorax stolpii]